MKSGQEIETAAEESLDIRNTESWSLENNSNLESLQHFSFDDGKLHSVAASGKSVAVISSAF